MHEPDAITATLTEAASTRRQAGPRPLRHRLLVAEPPAPARPRHAHHRPVLRGRARPLPRGHHHRRRTSSGWPRPSAWSRWPRASRRTSRSSGCVTSAATWLRATCSATPSRPTSSPSCWGGPPVPGVAATQPARRRPGRPRGRARPLRRGVSLSRMRAWSVHDLGEPAEVLSLEEVPDLVADGRGVLLTVSTCALNFADSLLCQGTYQDKPRGPSRPASRCAPGSPIQGRPGSTRGSGCWPSRPSPTAAWPRWRRPNPPTSIPFPTRSTTSPPPPSG